MEKLTKPKKDKSILVRVEDELKDFVVKESLDQHISEAQVVRHVLYEHMKKRKESDDGSV